jgi:tRNA(adenine34) deaminase
MRALTQAQSARGEGRLNECTLNGSKAPGAIGGGALVQARVGRVVFGVSDPRGGAAGGALDLLRFPGFNHHCRVTRGVGEAEARALLREFFARRRAR